MGYPFGCPEQEQAYDTDQKRKSGGPGDEHGREDGCSSGEPVIVKVGQELQAPDAQVIDASGLVVAPGLMDAHVHFRDPGYPEKEDINTGARAAAKGDLLRLSVWQIQSLP